MGIIINLLNGLQKLKEAWPIINANFTNTKTTVDAHIAGTSDKHASDKITYSGSFTSKNDVKAALDQAKAEIDTIVVSASVDPEVALARQSSVKSKSFATLDARLEESEQDHKTHLTEKAYKSIDRIKAKMKNGDTVLGVWYGDSTICGWNTTDNTGNVINAINGYNPWLTHSFGDEWEAIAINSCPVKLQTLLRDFYGNNNITIRNAGFGGAQMQDGWATNNFEEAVMVYGSPDFAIIAFGKNDTRTVNYDIENYYVQYKALVEKCFENNLIPIISTNDCLGLPDGARAADTIIDNERARVYDQIALQVSKEYDIPFIDMGYHLRDWLNNNFDGYKYRDVQADGTHLNDAGHNYKAGVAFKELAYDIIYTEGRNEVVITPEDNALHADSNVPEAPFYDWPNNIVFHRTARNLVNLALTTGSKLIKAWVFVEGEQPLLGFNALSRTIAQPKVKIYKNADATPYYDKEYGILHATGEFIYDYKTTVLKYGLNKIEIIAEADVLGSYLNYMWLRKWNDAYLQNTASPYFDTTYWADLGGIYTQYPETKSVIIPTTAARSGKYNIPSIQADGDNFAQLKTVGDIVHIDTTVKLNYGGLVIFPEQSINIPAASWYICLTAIAGTSGVDYKLNYPYVGTIVATGNDATGVLGAETKLCIDLERKASNVVNVKVYVADRTTTALINFDITNCSHFSGIVNGLLAINEPNSQAYAEIISMTVNAHNQ